MPDIAYFMGNNIIDTEDAKVVRDYYKQDCMKQFKLIYVVKSPDKKYAYISVAKDLKWSPYSEKGRLAIGYFREGEGYPSIMNISDIDYNEDAAEAELVNMAKEDKELEEIIENGSYYKVEEYIANLSKVPYIIVKKHDLSHIAQLVRDAKTVR